MSERIPDYETLDLLQELRERCPSAAAKPYVPIPDAMRQWMLDRRAEYDLMVAFLREASHAGLPEPQLVLHHYLLLADFGRGISVCVNARYKLAVGTQTQNAPCHHNLGPAEAVAWVKSQLEGIR